RKRREQESEQERKRREQESEQERKRREQESEQKWERQREETNRIIGKLGGRLGDMVECMVKSNLTEKFRELGFECTKAYPHAEIKDRQNNIVTEVDITLENGDKAIIVEVKNKLEAEDVADHLERMEKIRAYADLHDDRHTYLGAVAGIVMADETKQFALSKGFYVIEPSGDMFDVTAPQGKGLPREWRWKGAAKAEVREAPPGYAPGEKERHSNQRQEDEWLRQENEWSEQESERYYKKLQEKMERELNPRFGEMEEHLVKPCIIRRFEELGYNFHCIKPQYTLNDEQRNESAYFDIVLDGDGYAIAVKVFGEPDMEFIDRSVSELAILREAWNDEWNIRQKIRGAVVGARFGAEEKKAALEAGLYVLVQVGKTLKLEIPEGFVPREW
ncbi:MAG: hypothetical protein LBQ69_02375, partial [Treponema sp.]|nr:hypothetical protein [Treponema sp.]